jgi:hypothetical protein
MARTRKKSALTQSVEETAALEIANATRPLDYEAKAIERTAPTNTRSLNAHARDLRDIAAELHHFAHALHNMADEPEDDQETLERIRARITAWNRRQTPAPESWVSPRWGRETPRPPAHRGRRPNTTRKK